MYKRLFENVTSNIQQEPFTYTIFIFKFNRFYYIFWLIHRWISDKENWIYNEGGDPVICGNLTGARHCPVNYTCLCIGPNPNHGYTNFDNFLWSMLTTFQLITLDYWENVYNMVSSCNIHIPISAGEFSFHRVI